MTLTLSILREKGISHKCKDQISPREQLHIFFEGLRDNVKIVEICRREGFWLKEHYWQDFGENWSENKLKSSWLTS